MTDEIMIRIAIAIGSFIVGAAIVYMIANW